MTTVLERPTTATDAPVVDKRVVRRRLGPGKRIPFSLAIGPILLVGLWCAALGDRPARPADAVRAVGGRRRPPGT